MIKEIKFSGLAASPSDYEAPDGQLDLSLNLLRDAADALQPVLPPVKIRNFSSSQQPAPSGPLSPAAYVGPRPVFIHKTTSADMLIIVERKPSVGRTFISFCDRADSSSPLQNLDNFPSSFISCTAVGNTLVVLASDGIRYYLFKDAAYLSLGSRPPFVSISFGMVRVGELTDAAESEYPGCPRWSSKYFPGDGDGGNAVVYVKQPEDEALMQSVSNSVMGLLLSRVADKVTSQGLFYQPFFVRYAFRLYDGSYAWHSAPVLMLPDVCVPRVRITEKPSVSSDGVLSIKSALKVPYFALSRRILADGLANLAPWEDIVSSIDVFVSAPLYTYSQAEGVRGWTSLASIYARRKVHASDFADSSGASSSAEDGNHRPSESSGDPLPEYAFVGHYADSLSGNHQDHNVRLADCRQIRVWDIAPNDKFEDSITDTSLFYLFSSIPFKEILPDDAPVRLEADPKDLSSLVARKVLPDDWQSHFRMLPTCATVYNSRLHLCGMSLRLPEPLPVASAVPPSGSADTLQAVSVRVWSLRNGVRCSAVSSSHSDASLFPLSSEIPRFLWYPDPSAYMMMLQAGSRSVVVKLSPHPALNGAYWFAGLDASPSAPDAAPDSLTLPDTAPALSKVYVSDPTNPFTFPATGIVTVGSGSVFALSSAAKALSQGQFGQFPLYAFTSEGVWAMEVSSSGSYSARQPITRDVCINPDAIAQIDSAVLFPSSRGIMLLSGSSAQCISDAVDNVAGLDFSSLPGFRKLLLIYLSNSNPGVSLDESLSSDAVIPPFRQFLEHCGMIYDYVNQRIMVYNPAHPFAYLFSLRSKSWGMMRARIAFSLNSYPDALALDASGNLISFPGSDASGDAPDVPAILVSRPIKLGIPDALKTVDAIFQRGSFRKGQVMSALYGSRNLVDWHLVSSSVSHRILNRSGSPYKYFRIALVCSLAPGESISGCSVQFSPRLAGRLR